MSSSIKETFKNLLFTSMYATVIVQLQLNLGIFVNVLFAWLNLEN